MGWQWRQRWVSLGLGSAVSGGREKKKMKGRREGWWLWLASGHGRWLGSMRVEEERKKSKGEMMKLK